MIKYYSIDKTLIYQTNNTTIVPVEGDIVLLNIRDGNSIKPNTYKVFSLLHVIDADLIDDEHSSHDVIIYLVHYE